MLVPVTMTVGTGLGGTGLAVGNGVDHVGIGAGMTGITGIVAAKIGARHVDAVDNIHVAMADRTVIGGNDIMVMIAMGEGLILMTLGTEDLGGYPIDGIADHRVKVR